MHCVSHPICKNSLFGRRILECANYRFVPPDMSAENELRSWRPPSKNFKPAAMSKFNMGKNGTLITQLEQLSIDGASVYVHCPTPSLLDWQVAPPFVLLKGALCKYYFSSLWRSGGLANNITDWQGRKWQRNGEKGRVKEEIETRPYLVMSSGPCLSTREIYRWQKEIFAKNGAGLECVFLDFCTF